MLTTPKESSEAGRCHECRKTGGKVIVIELTNIVARLCTDCARELRMRLLYSIKNAHKEPK